MRVAESFCIWEAYKTKKNSPKTDQLKIELRYNALITPVRGSIKVLGQTVTTIQPDKTALLVVIF